MGDTGYRMYSSLPNTGSAFKWAQIDLSRLRCNYRTLCRAISSRDAAVRVISVVKADAYGHGAEECVRALLQENCDFFAVSCLEEALAVRRVCDECSQNADILILGYTDPSEVRLLFAHRLIQALLSDAYACRLNEAAEAAGVCVSVHVAVNTGMNRIGFDARNDREIEESARAIVRAASLSALSVCGMFTHFARADEETEEGALATRRQESRYRALRDRLEAVGLKIPFHHTCNSAAAIRGEATLFDGVRLGILLYGAAPALHGALSLLPVMRLEARILHVFTLCPGECLGYGGDFVADRERKIAVLGLGYADGWLRDYRGATVCVQTASGACEVPSVGRICMDQCMLDVTGTDACVGDTVTLFGDVPKRLFALAEMSNSIDYEVLCLISSRVLRTYKR